METGVVYSSGIIIKDEALLATLAVLYPTIHLPYMFGDLYGSYGVAIDKWHDKWEELFEDGVLKRSSTPALYATVLRFTPKYLNRHGTVLRIGSLAQPILEEHVILEYRRCQ